MILVIAAVVALLGGSALTARRLLMVITVDGPSMEPTLRSGERVLVRRTGRPRRGQVVVMRLPGYPADPQLLLKRVVAVTGDHVPEGWASPDVHGIGGAEVPRGHYVVLGDNSRVSTDSRYFGLVPRDRVVGVMVRPFPVPLQRGQVPDGSATGVRSGSGCPGRARRARATGR